MTVTLKLDTTALSNWITADPQFKLDLQQSVVENIAKRHINSQEKIVSKLVAIEVDKLTSPLGRLSNDRSMFRLNEPTKLAIQKAIDEELITMINASVEKWSNTATDQLEGIVDKTINRRLESMVTAKVTQMLKDRVDQAMAQLSQ